MKFKFIKSLMVIFIFTLSKEALYTKINILCTSSSVFFFVTGPPHENLFLLLALPSIEAIFAFYAFFISAQEKSQFKCSESVLDVWWTTTTMLNDFRRYWLQLRRSGYMRVNSIRLSRTRKASRHASHFTFAFFYCFQAINCMFFFYFILFMHNKSF